jgi:hypothetical protein
MWRWPFAAFAGLLIAAMLSLTDWTGFSRFHPEGRVPVPLNEIIMWRFPGYAAVVFLVAVLWPWNYFADEGSNL